MVIQVRRLRTNGTKVYANNLIHCFKYEFTTMDRHQFITDVAIIFEFQTEPKNIKKTGCVVIQALTQSRTKIVFYDIR